jgi:hypothetical protein
MVFEHARRTDLVLALVLAFGVALACSKPRAPEGGASPRVVSAPSAAGPAAGSTVDAAGVPPMTRTPDRLQKVVIDGARGALIPGEMAGKGHFTPTEADARTFESGLVAFLAKSRPPEDPDLYRKVGSYVRQYTGGTQDGRRLLFVTFACREDAGWGERFLVINDGGSCYVDVGYDLDAGAYTYVGVHHDA